MQRGAGFTLIELLVALSVMALLAVLSWRSVDGMSRAQADVSARADAALTLQASLGQFKFDLDAITQTPGINSLDWDGRVLRLTRLAAVPSEGLQVVAWTRRADGGNANANANSTANSGQWLRWQSPALRGVGNWTQAWEQAGAWAQNASADSQLRETFILALADWQIFYFRNNAWSNPLSSDGAVTGALAINAAKQVSVPDGIRLVLSLPSGQAFAGKLTLDWVKPTLSADKP